MSISCFEGFEKRLEVHFSGDHPVSLRLLCCDALTEVLDAVQCTVVSAVSNHYFDSYILSESSLFVYPHKMILKTCGTTQLLRSLPCLLRHAEDLGLRLRSCRFSRGSFIFPDAQPSPHTSFTEEVRYLDERLPAVLCFRRACLIPSNTSHAWHVYAAADSPEAAADGFTVEVCMKELDRSLAKRFFRREGDLRSGDAAGAEMTELTGIPAIHPRSLVFGFAFDPCGYSMNGLDRDNYSTVHVTPEEGNSYASFECTGRWSSEAVMELTESLSKVIGVFRPSEVSVSLCMDAPRSGVAGEERRAWVAVAAALEPLGLRCWSWVAEEFPGAGVVTYQTFSK